MAEKEYKSLYTGEQVDEAVGIVLGDNTSSNTNLLTKDDIVQNIGPSQQKVMSQYAVTQYVQNYASINEVLNAIGIHNTDSASHPDIRRIIASKPDALNEKGTSQINTYSQNYINQNFVGMTLATKLYATKQTANTAIMTTKMPAISNNNLLELANSTNTEFNTDADFFFIRTLESVTILSNTSSFSLTLPFIITRETPSANISFAAKLSVSLDGGKTWTEISTRQAFGATVYDVGVGNTAIMTIFTDAIDTDTAYNIGTMLRIELFKKQSSTTPLTMQIYCGVEVDNNDIFTTMQFNFENVFIDTNQIADGSITYSKLDETLQVKIQNIDQKLNKRTNDGSMTQIYAYNGQSQGSLQVSNIPLASAIPYFDGNGNLKTGTALRELDCVNLHDMNAAIDNVFGYDELFEIPKENWATISDKSPFMYSTQVVATHTILDSSEVELINNNAVSFANYGFAIGNIYEQTITFYALEVPSGSTFLRVRFRDKEGGI